MILSPICLFVYKRLDLTIKTVTSLKKNLYANESDLFIFSDAPKNDKDKYLVSEVRKYIKSIDDFKSVKIIERKNNLGLAESVISGVTEVINQYGKVIVLEDDLLTSEYFLKYMNEALDKYQNENKVISIHGYIYPVKIQLPETFFLRGADCWGWATWERAWDTFEKNGKNLLNEIIEKKLAFSFDHNGTTNNLKMLKKHIKGKVDSWAIRWHASAYLQNKLTMYPGKSLVNNIGMGGESTHIKETSVYNSEIFQKPIELKDIAIEEDIYAKKEIEKFFTSIKPNFLKRYFKKFKYSLGM